MAQQHSQVGQSNVFYVPTAFKKQTNHGNGQWKGKEVRTGTRLLPQQQRISSLLTGHSGRQG